MGPLSNARSLLDPTLHADQLRTHPNEALVAVPQDAPKRGRIVEIFRDRHVATFAMVFTTAPAYLTVV